MLHVSQAARFSQNTSEITHFSHREIQNRIAWLNRELVLTGELLSYVIAEISRYNDIQISITPKIRDLEIGGRFDMNDVARILQVLQISEGLDIYTLKDRTIYLSKKKIN